MDGALAKANVAASVSSVQRSLAQNLLADVISFCRTSSLAVKAPRGMLTFSEYLSNLAADAYGLAAGLHTGTCSLTCPSW